jgi:holo-[acyl-carrier protein] synthase
VILGCGVDLIEVGRIERELTRRGGDPFDELFTPDELAWCRSRRRPAEGYALGFAAKEAILKALGTGLAGSMAWTDMRIDWTGTWPAVALSGGTAAVAEVMGVQSVHLTATMLRAMRSGPEPASTTHRATSTNLGATLPDTDVTFPTVTGRHSWEPASAGSITGTLAAAWVVVTGTRD